MKDISLDLYRTFLVAARCSSVSEAAKQLFISQPAVSTSIQRLERELGLKLFYRQSRGLTLTYEGSILFEYVKNGLAYIQAGEDRLHEIQGLSDGLLRVGASDMTLKFFLLDYIEEFHGKYPNIRLTVTNAPTPLTLRELKEERIDFGVVSGPLDSAAYSGFEFMKVREIRDIIVASDKFLIGRNGALADVYELAEYPLIMLERETSTRRYLDSLLPREIMEGQPSIELATSDLILDFARRGLGVAFIVADFAREAIESGLLHEIRLTTPIPPRHFLLAYQRNAPFSPAAAHFFDMIQTRNNKREAPQ